MHRPPNADLRTPNINKQKMKKKNKKKGEEKVQKKKHVLLRFRKISHTEAIKIAISLCF